jgi:hypothetical protein
MLTAMAVRTCCSGPWAARGSGSGHAVAAGELADGALDAGPDGVALMPGGVLLAGAVADLQLVELARGEAHGALAVAGGGAGGPDRAGLALALGEAATISGAASGEEVG